MGAEIAAGRTKSMMKYPRTRPTGRRPDRVEGAPVRIDSLSWAAGNSSARLQEREANSRVLCLIAVDAPRCRR
jgi:hypothetical protein